MKREINDKTILDTFIIDFASILEKHCKYIVVSGFVAIAHGRSRGTEDIDIIIEKISKKKFINLFYELFDKGFECMQSQNPEVIYDRYLKQKDSIRFVRKNEFLPEAELKFAKDELDEIQLKSRKKFPFTGLDIWFSNIEINIAFKEELLKSKKDFEDSRHLRIIYKDEISEENINEIKKKIRKFRLKR